MQTGCIRMKDMKKILFSIMFSVALTGCTTQWVPVGSHYTPFNEANAECNIEALQQFPVRNEVAQRSSIKTVKHYCPACCKSDKADKSDKDCYFDQSVPTTESYVMDVNERSRHQLYSSCMERNGWEEQTKYLF